MFVQGLDQADKGFSPEDELGTNIIQEVNYGQWGKDPNCRKNNIEKPLSWGNGHTQAVQRLRHEREPSEVRQAPDSKTKTKQDTKAGEGLTMNIKTQWDIRARAVG